MKGMYLTTDLVVEYLFMYIAGFCDALHNSLLASKFSMEWVLQLALIFSLSIKNVNNKL